MANDFNVDFFIDPDSPGLFVNQLGECDGLFGLDAFCDGGPTPRSLEVPAGHGGGSVRRRSDENGVDAASISETVHADDASDDDDDDGLYGNEALMPTINGK
ncbi:hypothetical protein VF21_10129 [Pseudogymnoascus sp. 05NY08]|nr:hypothetical protein VF21_10129 [Pseudogymnoascus sp. 05NY08]